uniref:UDP-N-acetylglucosamine transporter n=1 Tax=Syphacia muris TaxID=451379 RepID=A0A0N5AJX6_9BILA
MSSETSGIRDLLFKSYIVLSMTFVWAAYAITTRYTRSTKPELYSSTTVVLLSECVKITITLICLFYNSRYDCSNFRKVIIPIDLLKMSVPSITYVLQNNLDIVALSNLDAATYQVTTQLKVITTALFMMAFLGKKFSLHRWIAILLLFMGVAAVQLNAVSYKTGGKATGDNYILGLAAVLLICIMAGFAGVYFEMMLKDGTSTPLWIRNLQMYSCGVVAAGIGCYINDYDSIKRRGFFYGYDFRVFGIVCFLSVGGIYISLIMKYLDNLYKSFASSVSIILVVVFSVFLFDDVYIGMYFITGTVMVISAIVLYNRVSE